ncbi:MAG: hypothetical protein EP298_07020 [Gammaproteobacteria bacterium]|nr:MAG: hypothetical protein EP298_07020 [Gammaproteobacteria bacterium]UTW42986.1 hypothetical protein KFE69_02260 [bacterium SCSIO 12844]
MKKVIFTSTIAIALSSISYAMTSKATAKSGLVFEGQFSVNATPQNTFDYAKDNNTNTSSDERNGGIGGGLFIGYDYAFNPNITVGGKVGYQYLYEVNYLKLDGTTHGDIDVKLSMNNFPILATWKYFFNSGWLIGADGGIVIQKWTVDGTDSTTSRTDNHSSQWNVAPMLGVSGGYKWQNGLALTGSLSYIFGKSTDELSDSDDNNALAVWTLGINLSYTLPL